MEDGSLLAGGSHECHCSLCVMESALCVGGTRVPPDSPPHNDSDDSACTGLDFRGACRVYVSDAASSDGLASCCQWIIQRVHRKAFCFWHIGAVVQRWISIAAKHHNTVGGTCISGLVERAFMLPRGYW
eukprot:3038089-Amphidinium_carterae.1